jgi:D-sedoheptulose 7-phosphate isomerase
MMDRDRAYKMTLGAIAEAQRTTERLIAESFDQLWRGFEILRDTFRADRHVHVCGNGGSAADAQHFVTELVVRLDSASTRRPLPATALTTDTSILTAASNDLGFEHVFARQIEARARRSDLLVLISTSGNSPNLLLAAEAARMQGMKTVALLGKNGGRLKSMVDCAVVVPSESTQRIQEVHTLCLHLWCEWLEGEFPVA